MKYVFIIMFLLTMTGCSNKKLELDNINLIKYNEGDIVSDAILNKIQINSKELQDNILHMKVKSKSGEYNFKFRRA